MLDERPIIASWKARIDDFIMKYPDKKDSVEVVRLQEHIHELELAAKKYEEENK